MLWAVKEVAGLRGMRRGPEKIRSSGAFTRASPFTALASLNSSDPGDKVEQSSRNNQRCKANGNGVLIQEKKKWDRKGRATVLKETVQYFGKSFVDEKKKMTSTLIMSWEWNIASLYFLGWVCRQSTFYPVGWRLELLGVCCEYSHSRNLPKAGDRLTFYETRPNCLGPLQDRKGSAPAE